jgi:hypothetical protein
LDDEKIWISDLDERMLRGLDLMDDGQLKSRIDEHQTENLNVNES